ncbi:MAG: hypothetical protein IPL08_04410 [Saprospiraceae bacterium]|nr:hypothetical protein [Saprospiraceae bacterium]
MVYQLNDIIYAVYKNKMFQFHKQFATSKVFLEKSKNKYCGSSLNLNCRDRNRNSYQVCIEIEQSSKNKFKFLSSDSCSANYFDLKGNELTLIRNNDMEILWDSIIISYDDFPLKRTKILNLDGDKSEPNLIHPFTITQEVYFIVKKDFTLINSVSTNENTLVISIFNEGNLIKRTRGNLFPNLLHNINSLIE